MASTNSNCFLAAGISLAVYSTMPIKYKMSGLEGAIFCAFARCFRPSSYLLCRNAARLFSNSLWTLGAKATPLAGVTAAELPTGVKKTYTVWRIPSLLMLVCSVSLLYPTASTSMSNSPGPSWKLAVLAALA